MQLVYILMVAVAILSVLSGIAILFGSAKGKRGQAAAYFVACLAGAGWLISMVVFLTTPVGQDARALAALDVMYVSAATDVIALLMFVGWKRQAVIFGSIALAIAAAVLLTLIITNPTDYFGTIALSRTTNNTVIFAKTWMPYAYAALVSVASLGFLVAGWYEIQHAPNKRVKSGAKTLFYGLIIAGALAGTFDVVLPLLGNYSLIWIGPISTSLVIFAHFYATIRFRLLVLNSNWLKTLAYVILTSLAAMVYMVIFFVIFMALFKIPNPSASIIVLNFIMIVIVLLLLPVINEVMAYVRSLISVGQVDIAYVIKKLNRLATQNVNLNELASFLADHMHFQYIGLVVNGRLYGSSSLPISADELAELSVMESTDNGAWQKVTGKNKELFEKLDLTAAAELRNAKGRPFGQILVGKPLGKMTFERRDLIQLEMIINLVATVIDSKRHLKA